jgi:hypothetical protein
VPEVGRQHAAGQQCRVLDEKASAVLVPAYCLCVFRILSVGRESTLRRLKILMTKVEMELEASLLYSLKELFLRSERLIPGGIYYVKFKSIFGNIKCSLFMMHFHFARPGELEVI